MSRGEAEQVFFKHPLAVRESEKRSAQEPRYYALGQTDVGRRLFVVFTIRDNLVRVISARDVNRRERRVYEHAKSEATEADPEV